jgi:hypothetical protein
MSRKYKNIFPMDIFLGQIRKIMDEFNIKNYSEFDRRAGLKNKAARWFNEDYRSDSVDTDTLLSIHKAFNKPLDWLVFGEPQPLQGSESRPQPYEERTLSKIDFELAHRIRGRIEDELAKAGKNLPEDLKLKLLIKIYNDCMEKHISMEHIDINDYLWFLD